MIPGISVDDTNAEFKTNKPVFAVALVAVVSVLLWAIIAPDNIATVGGEMRNWVVRYFGWFFTALMTTIIVFMVVIACRSTGKIRLGADDSTPEFSTLSWISMLFAAGLGIGLVFYGPMEPLSHFLTPPSNVDAAPGTQDAVIPAITQSILHQATLPWGLYL